MKNNITVCFHKASYICNHHIVPIDPKRSRKGFKAGTLGGHVGVKFKLGSESLAKTKKRLEKEFEKKAAIQHKARLAPK